MTAPSKNVLVIMSDEHESRTLGCAGHPLVQTPHLDTLATRGVRFTNAYTPSPICVPARAAFATGRSVHELHHWDNAMPYTGEVRGWGHVLQDHGVRVESIGKLHYRNAEDPAGFDAEHVPMHVVGGHGMVWASIRDPFLIRDRKKRMLGDYIGPGESSYTSYDRDITARTVEWLKEAGTRRDQPFVLYVGLVAPHFPLVAPDEFYRLYPPHRIPEPKLRPANGYVRHPWVEERASFHDDDSDFHSPEERLQALAAYYGLCSFLDDNVGQILRALEQSGLAAETTVIYTSDHGDNLGCRGMWGKATLYQESTGIPLLISGPDIEPGIKRTPVSLLDLYPTILAAAGIPPEPHLEDRTGQDLRVLAQNPEQHERTILSEYHAAGSNSGAFMLRQGRWKYHYYVGHPPELFDLEADPDELQDLASDPAVADILAQLEASLRRICDPEAIDRQAKADQRAMIDRLGGPAIAATLGARGATPPPGAEEP
ncbi:MAG: sulfatase-like hydrolase/transferase [Pigmentiphaga sp.]|nr:sulfatase-like hydrolase/transferase [Pigmentiphaga sp.]